MASMQVLYKRLLDNDATKEDEIEILHKLSIAAFESGAYMKHLLTADLLGWFRGKLQGDILPDLMGELEAARADVRTAESDAGDYEAERDDLRTRVAELEQDLEAARGHTREELAAADEKYARDMAEQVARFEEVHKFNQENIESLALAERKLRAVRNLAGGAYLDERDITPAEVKQALQTLPPTFPEWSGTNPHHYDEVA